MAIVDFLLPEFDHEMATTRRLLERVPEDRFAWKPHVKSFSLGQLAQHVANLPRWGHITLEQSEFDLAGSGPAPEAETRAAVLAAFDSHVASARAALVGKTDGELMVPWSLKRGDQTMFTMPKASVWRSFVMNHLVHHRGQLSVYLRQQDVPLPSMYGPSADEQAF
jgi:uncharacterized damage-inducible protein DinB